MSEEIPITIPPGKNSIPERAADKFAQAFKLASDPKAWDPHIAAELVREGINLILDFEVGLVRQEMQKEIDVRQDEIQRLLRERSGPKEFQLGYS